jgi:hypothetical protein
MIRFIAALCLMVSLGFSPVRAQIPDMPKPAKEHEWLKKFVGEWETEGEASMGPGIPAVKCKGTQKTRLLGSFWVVSEPSMDMQGMKMQAVQTIGYDLKKKKYIGTWIDGLTDYLWTYEGDVDATGRILSLEADGPNMMKPEKMARFRDAYEFKSDDHIVQTSSMKGDDGKWVTFMTGTLKKKK